MNKVSKCSFCGSSITIKEYYCPECNVTVRGEFAHEGLLKLSPEKQDFLFRYLSLRGNLSELGNQIGVSYPTVRQRFDELLAELGIKTGSKPIDEEKRSEITDILAKIDSGEITSKDGMDLIKKFKRR